MIQHGSWTLSLQKQEYSASNVRLFHTGNTIRENIPNGCGNDISRY